MYIEKEELIEYQQQVDKLNLAKAELKAKKEAFDEQNKELIEQIKLTNEQVYETKEDIKKKALTEYERTNEKQLLGGIGIQVRKLLEYDDENALEWAKKHGLCLSLDKKAFETIAKTQKFKFVMEGEDVIVTFPKQIKLDES